MVWVTGEEGVGCGLACVLLCPLLLLAFCRFERLRNVAYLVRSPLPLSRFWHDLGYTMVLLNPRPSVLAIAR